MPLPPILEPVNTSETCLYSRGFCSSNWRRTRCEQSTAGSLKAALPEERQEAKRHRT